MRNKYEKRSLISVWFELDFTEIEIFFYFQLIFFIWRNWEFGCLILGKIMKKCVKSKKSLSVWVTNGAKVLKQSFDVYVCFLHPQFFNKYIFWIPLRPHIFRCWLSLEHNIEGIKFCVQIFRQIGFETENDDGFAIAVGMSIWPVMSLNACQRV